MSRPPALATQRRQFVAAVVVTVALLVVFAGGLAPGISLGLRRNVSAVGLLVAGSCTALGCWVRSRRARGRRRRSWRLLTGAAVVAVAGNLWVSFAGGHDPVTSPSPVSDASIALALVLAIAGLLNFPSVRRRGVELLVLSLDGLIIGAAVLVMAADLVYSELLDNISGTTGSRFTTLLIPMLDVVLATLALLLVLRSRGSDRTALGLVTMGFLLYAVADLTFAVQVARRDFQFGTLLDLGWIVGYLVLALAAWYPDAETDPTSGTPAITDVAAEIRDSALVWLVLMLAAVVQFVSDSGHELEGAQSALWLVLALAVGCRQVLLSRDNAHLRRGLELRVRDQTADLRRLGRQNEVLLTSVGDGIYGVDRHGLITFVNPSGAELLGYAAGDLLGRPAHQTFHAADQSGRPLPYEGCYIAEAIRQGRVASGEEDVYLRADGSSIPVEITASPLVDGAEDGGTADREAGDGEARGAVVVFRDVTQRREVDRLKDEFISVVSHELRTPLTSIRGSLGLLVGGALGELAPRARSMVTVALESSERLTRLINDILDLERIESGNRPMDVLPVEAVELLRSAASEMAGLSQSTGVRIEILHVSGRVLADRDRVVQALTNLLSNAVKFSRDGDVVTMEATQQGGQVLFRVRDRGRGIPADKLESIFERFEQVDSSDARQKGGTGLGLAISRGIIDRHGGRIWAESEPGAGTTMSFVLPAVHRAASEDDPEPDDAPTILICDDDPATVETFSMMLRRHGYRAVGVTEGGEALARATRDRPAALLLDLRLPDTTGAEVVASLRSGERTSSIPVVVISGMGPEVDPQLPDRVQGWLVKPVSEDRLVTTLDLILEGRREDSVVLLVEDDEDLASIITTLLSSHGLRVVRAGSARDAILAGDEVRPHVVVLDLHLPDGDGYEVVAEFRRRSWLARTPLVVYSAADVDADRQGDLRLGETVFLTKGRAAPEVLEDRVLGLVNAVTGRGDDPLSSVWATPDTEGGGRARSQAQP